MVIRYVFDHVVIAVKGIGPASWRGWIFKVIASSVYRIGMDIISGSLKIFKSLNPTNGKIHGQVAKEHLKKSNLSNMVLMKIWRLSDIDKDGHLDIDEFALCNYLIKLQLENSEIPNELPDTLVPPSKRKKRSMKRALNSR
ncbi:hypothetical protein RF11_01738 [Thelohanellus kitauei]|uniref:Uncharacterized protein n=1 Tax=Thelohanellus kitauei TaxID=669202 RepID=A0A0C2N2G7_THEKT|nr:hypothetical protein RF11_01738 [Thelohanellus kitauei]